MTLNTSFSKHTRNIIINTAKIVFRVYSTWAYVVNVYILLMHMFCLILEIVHFMNSFSFSFSDATRNGQISQIGGSRSVPPRTIPPGQLPPTNSPLDNSPPGQFPPRSITPVGNSPLVNSHPGQFPPWSIAPWIIAPWTVAPRAFSPLGRFPSAPHTHMHRK